MLESTQLDDFLKLAANGGRVPVFHTIPADLLTPVEAYRRLTQGGGDSFLLESAEQGRGAGRFSLMGVGPTRLVEWSRTNSAGGRAGGVMDVWRQDPGLGPVVRDPRLSGFYGGAIGYIEYDFIRELERVPDRHGQPGNGPLACFGMFETVVIFDHLFHVARVVHLAGTPTGEPAESRFAAAREVVREVAARLVQPVQAPRGGGAAGPLEPEIDDAAFSGLVRRAQEHIRAGDVYQVVLSRRFTAPSQVEPLDVYRAMRMINPSPYMFFIRLGGRVACGASPERLVRVSGRRVETMPIAGTRPRGADRAADSAQEQEMLTDPKEVAEHAMLVDLGRNDLGRVCRPGSVEVSECMAVQRLSHVMHMTSRVEGELRPDRDALDALAACFPAGTVSGAPKIRAMELIDELEPSRRGLYAGAVGWWEPGGDLDTCIAIRTAEFRPGEVEVRAGAGVVVASRPDGEAQETRHKAAAAGAALRIAAEGLPCC